MNQSGYYPLGASTDPNAPWNQKEQPSVKAKVLVSITLSKTVEVEVSNYQVLKTIDEDGNPTVSYDFSECDLKKAVQNQILLPDKAYERLYSTVFSSDDSHIRRKFSDLNGWNVDDFEAMPDD